MLLLLARRKNVLLNNGDEMLASARVVVVLVVVAADDNDDCAGIVLIFDFPFMLLLTLVEMTPLLLPLPKTVTRLPVYLIDLLLLFVID